MKATAKSLDHVERPLGDTPFDIDSRDLAAKLQRYNSIVIVGIPRQQLIAVSEWSTYMNGAPWEVAVVQDSRTRQLRLINGSATSSDKIPAMISSRHKRPDDIFIVHVHPVVRSLASHVQEDQRKASLVLEGALDWSDTLLCYDKNKLYNVPLMKGGTEAYSDASVAARHGRIPFLRGDVITGYRHFDKDTHLPNFINPFVPR